MENSILTSTKKILGVAANYTTFDPDIITHINAALSSLNQLGIGPTLGFGIEDDSAVWAELTLPLNQLSMVRAYIYMKVRMMFDPPTTSFHIEAMNKQIAEFEFRLNVNRENLIPQPVVEVIVYD